MIASFSCDHVRFIDLADPLVPVDISTWAPRPWPDEVYAYVSMMNYTDGNNQVGNGFLLTHVYVQPNEDFTRRYLVFRDVAIGVGTAGTTPQVGVAQVHPEQHRPGKLRTGEEGAVQPRAGQVGLAQVDALQLQAGEIAIGEIGPPAAGHARQVASVPVQDAAQLGRREGAEKGRGGGHSAASLGEAGPSRLRA